MHDILPAESGYWQYLESTYRALLASYGYQEIRFPILEETQLFKRSVGEVTDIVEKEMYTFLDRNQESLTLRPEGTAGCVRAAEQHGLLYNQIQRLYYNGPMFRYERPQKGRARQFHQLGVEAFGISGNDIELELILLSARLFKHLGVLEHVSLQINSIGDSEARAAFGRELLAYLSKHKDKLDADSQERLNKNPLRILDSKDQGTQAVLKTAPKLEKFLSKHSAQRYADLKQSLNALGIGFTENPALVRGLDYYNDLVFEWVSSDLGAQATVCAGGRYDHLVETLGGRATPAAGFAVGLERLILLLSTLERLPELDEQSDVIILYTAADEQAASVESFVLGLAENIRSALPTLKVVLNCGRASLKSQMKKADKSGAALALIIGEQEFAQQSVQVKFLRNQTDSQTLDKNAVIELLHNYFLTRM